MFQLPTLVPPTSRIAKDARGHFFLLLYVTMTLECQICY